MIGVNPWVAHANRSVYGEDADVFRPERWMEEESMDGENKMEQYFFTVCTFNVLLVFSHFNTGSAQSTIFLARVHPPIPPCQEGSVLGVISTHLFEKERHERRMRLANVGWRQ